MVIINHNKITISKGDNVVLGMKVKVDNQIYNLQNGDTLTFSIGTFFKKVVSVPKLEISSAETAAFPIGSYYYDVLLTYASGEKITVCFPTDFVVREVYSNA